MGQHCIICNFPCDEDVLFCPDCVDADKTNERKIVNEEVRELHRLWGEDCERMNKEIDRNGKMATICEESTILFNSETLHGKRINDKKK